MWLKPQGYACVTSEDGVKECSTSTCAHCQKITHIQAGSRPEDVGGLCYACMGLICPTCVGKPCSPFLKQVEEIEAAFERKRVYEGII